MIVTDEMRVCSRCGRKGIPVVDGKPCVCQLCGYEGHLFQKQDSKVA